MNRLHLPTIGAVVLLTLLTLGAGFSAGRYMVPGTKVVQDRHTITELQKIETTQVQKMDLEEMRKIVAEMVQKISSEMIKKNNLYTEKTKTTKPNGEVEEKEITKDQSETNSKTSSETSSKITSDVLTKQTLISELKLLTEQLKINDKSHTDTETNDKSKSGDYRAGVYVGYDFASLLGVGSGFNLVPVSGLVLQLQVERRLFLGINGVLWLQSTGVGGAGLSGGL